MPERIQLSRQKGWRKPEGAIVVSRPSRWGNPFLVHEAGLNGCERHDFNCVVTPEIAVTRLRHAILWPISGEPGYPTLGEIRVHLRGHDLGWWCPLSGSCHADLLLELAND